LGTPHASFEYMADLVSGYRCVYYLGWERVVLRRVMSGISHVFAWRWAQDIFQKIADPAEIAPTAAVAFTITIKRRCSCLWRLLCCVARAFFFLARGCAGALFVIAMIRVIPYRERDRFSNRCRPASSNSLPCLMVARVFAILTGVSHATNSHFATLEVTQAPCFGEPMERLVPGTYRRRRVRDRRRIGLWEVGRLFEEAPDEPARRFWRLHGVEEFSCRNLLTTDRGLLRIKWRRELSDPDMSGGRSLLSTIAHRRDVPEGGRSHC